MAYRIVAKSPDHLNDIVEDIMSWFETARDYRAEFDTESRKFADPATKQIVTKKIDVLHVQDPMTGKKTVIKFIPLLRPEEMKIEMGGENEHVMKGKLKNMMKGRGEFKTYNKDTLRKMESKMKVSELRQIIKEETQVVLFEQQLQEGKLGDFLNKIKAAALKAAQDNYQDAIKHIDTDKATSKPLPAGLLAKAQGEIEMKSQNINEGFVDTIRKYATKGRNIGLVGSVTSAITALSAAAQYLESSFSTWYYSTIQGLADTEVTRIISDLYGADAMRSSADMIEGSIWFKLGMYAFVAFFVIAVVSIAAGKLIKK